MLAKKEKRKKVVRNLAKIAIKKKKKRKEVAKNLIAWSVSKRPCQPIFPVKRVPSRSIPLLPSTNLLRAVQNEIYSKRNDPGSLSRTRIYIITNYLRIKNADSLSFSGERPILLRIYSLLRLKDREDNRASLPRKRGSWGSKAHNHFVLILLTYLGARYSCAFLRLEADVHTLLIFIHEGKAVYTYIFFLSLLI